MEDIKKTHTLSAYVNNKPGVLMRICQVFSRRAYNIDSLVVSNSKESNFSRMTISISGEPEGLPQIIMQVNKLIDVVHCAEHTTNDSIAQELVLIKVQIGTSDFNEISHIINHFEGKTLDLTNSAIVTMIHGNPEKVDWAIKVLSKFNLLEIIRSGKIVIATSGNDT